MRLAAFGYLARGKAGAVTLLFLDGPDNIDFFHSDNPDTLFDGNLFDFSECHVLSPFLIHSCSATSAKNVFPAFIGRRLP
jgi:hypothetical protein